MYVVRDVFHCKPGQSKAIAEKFKAALPIMKTMTGFISARVLVDYVGSYWTVVMEMEVESLALYEKQMTEYSSHEKMREALKGYMDQVNGGHREIFKVV
jgi:heme-degrading monooxygenase HmoA